MPAAHIVTASSARADNWGEHRGATTAKGWGKLIFEDDFNTGAIDTKKWRVRDRDYVSYDAGVIMKDAVTAGPDTSAKIWLKKLAKPVTYSDGKLREWGHLLHRHHRQILRRELPPGIPRQAARLQPLPHRRLGLHPAPPQQLQAPGRNRHL